MKVYVLMIGQRNASFDSGDIYTDCLGVYKSFNAAQDYITENYEPVNWKELTYNYMESEDEQGNLFVIQGSYLDWDK